MWEIQKAQSSTNQEGISGKSEGVENSILVQLKEEEEAAKTL